MHKHYLKCLYLFNYLKYEPCSGFLPGGGGSGPPTQHHRGGFPPPPLMAKKIYIPYFAVIPVKIGHFKHLNWKNVISFSHGRGPPDPPPFGPPSQTFLAETLMFI